MIKNKWTVDDGYAGAERPQYATVDEDYLADRETEEEARDYIDECVRDHFNERVSYGYLASEEDKVLAKWQELRDKLKAKEEAEKLGQNNG